MLTDLNLVQDDFAYDVGVDSQNRIYVATNGSAISLQEDGTRRSDYGPFGFRTNGPVYTIRMDVADNLLSRAQGGQGGVTRYLPDGSVDTTFADNGTLAHPIGRSTNLFALGAGADSDEIIFYGLSGDAFWLSRYVTSELTVTTTSTK